MIETFTLLFAAHVAADYLAQTKYMVDHKRRPAILALHIALVFGFGALALGFTGWLVLAAVTAIHAAMDAVKTYLWPSGRVWPYLADQGVHILTLIGAAALFPALGSDGLWARLAPDLHVAALPIVLIIAASVFAVIAGGYAVALLLGELSPPAEDADQAPTTDGPTADAGQWIGQLERGLVVLFILIGHPEGIGFLIAAKSILRFGVVQNDKHMSEVVLVGTLASVAWALVVAILLVAHLPDATLETIR